MEEENSDVAKDISLRQACDRLVAEIGKAHRVRMNQVLSGESEESENPFLDVEAQRYLSIILEKSSLEPIETINIEEIKKETTEVVITWGKNPDGLYSRASFTCLTFDEMKTLVEAMIILAQKGHLS